MPTRRPADPALWATAIAAYLLLVLCLWAWYGLNSGMGYETYFAYQSESGGRGRYFGDNMRRFTSVFYHLAYVAGDWLGIAGSYLPYQGVYALLWLLRGLLVFQIVRMLGDSRGVTAFLAGAFTILHAADGSLNWVGQLNQFGFIFWMLFAFVVLLKSFEFEQRLWIAVPLAIVGTQLARLCIYSYESPLPLIFAFPVLALLLFAGWSWRKLLLLAVFYSLPVQYCWRWLTAALDRTADGSYQYSVLRHDWGIASLLGDWIRNIWHSLAFWQWPRQATDAPTAEFLLVVVACALLAASALIAALRWLQQRSPAFSEAAVPGRLEVRLLALGLAMVALSFPVYLLLSTATSDWRTQLLSGPGAGIAFGAAAAIVARRPWPRPVQGTWLAAGLTVSLAVAAVWAAQASALMHRQQWEQHRAIMAGVLAVAPRVLDNTVLILVNQGSQPLIFGDNLWWDFGVRLAYPKRTVAGVYYDKPKQAAAGATVRIDGAALTIESPNDLLVARARISELLVFDVLPGNGVRIAGSLPEWLEVDPQLGMQYQPGQRIGPWPPDDRALRRFGPIVRR